MKPDPIGTANTLIASIYAACNWLVDTQAVGATPAIPALSLTTPQIPYPLAAPRPFGVLRIPTHSTSADEDSQTTGNIPGRFNVYTLYYYEAAYVAATSRLTEELRCIQTYAAIAQALRPPNGTTLTGPSQYAEVLSVAMRQDPNGPFILLGQEAWIGIAIEMTLKEEY